jgi:AraC family transcriptional regulator
VSDPLDHSQRKYAVGEILGTSGPRQWSEIAAELRQHPAVILPSLEQRHVEICIATRNDNTLITRKAGGESQESRSEPGKLWLCPAGVKSDETQSHGPIEFLHLYLPPSRFDSLSEICGGAHVPATAVGYLNGIRDEVILQAGMQILTEMRRETAAGRVLVDALGLFLTVRLAHVYAITQGRSPELAETRHGLGDERLARVLDYMREHIEEEISIEELASVACLSAFHFARMFRASMGVPPHRYLSSLRLDRAKVLLARSDTPIAEIALATCFSTQANFTRAFRAATEMTPGEFRRRSR